MQRYDDALAALDEVERISPGEPAVAISRGVVYACANRIPQAIAAFEIAELNRPAEALEAFQTADCLEPNHPPTCYNLGHILLKLDQPEVALPWLEKAAGSASETLRAWHEIGRACERFGRR